MLFFKPMRSLFGIGIIFFMAGCVPVLIGVGAVGGYMITKDAVQGSFEVSYDKLWNASIDLLEAKGELILNSKRAGIIKAKIKKDTVTIKIKEITERTQTLRVSARTAGVFANLTLAQNIFSEIVGRIHR